MGTPKYYGSFYLVLNLKKTKSRCGPQDSWPLRICAICLSTVSQAVSYPAEVGLMGLCGWWGERGLPKREGQEGRSHLLHQIFKCVGVHPEKKPPFKTGPHFSSPVKCSGIKLTWESESWVMGSVGPRISCLSGWPLSEVLDPCYRYWFFPFQSENQSPWQNRW